MPNIGGHFSSRVQEYAGTLTYFVGDLLPNLTLELAFDGGGGAIDLTGATVTVSISRLNGSTAVKTAAASVRDNTGGIALFTWGVFTFNSPGTYVGQARIDFDGTTPLSTQKFLIEVLPRVAGL